MRMKRYMLSGRVKRFSRRSARHAGSREEQIRLCNLHIRSEPIVVALILHKIDSDGVSALDNLVQRKAQTNDFDAVLISDVMRLSRNGPAEVVQNLFRLVTAGISVIADQ